MEPRGAARSLPVESSADLVEGGFQGVLFNALQDAVLFARFPDRRVLDVNGAFCRLFGVTREKALSGTTAFMYPDVATFQRVGETIGAAMREGRAAAIECELQRVDGTTFPGEIALHPVGVYAEAPMGAVSIIRDLTLEKANEARELGQRRALKTLLRAQSEIGANLELERVVQAATDAAVILSEASFGAFFYNTLDDAGERYMLYTLSGAPREAFEKFPMPRKTRIFEPTFEGAGIVRSADITKDPRYGRSPPHHGMPPGHLPVRSYLAVPVISRDGTVHGGFFLGHPDAGRFTSEHEALVGAVASQTATALDNAQLYRRARSSEERLKRILENAPVQIATVDREGTIVSLNRSARGLPVQEVIGTSAYAAVAASERERVRSIIEGVMTTGVPAEYEVQGPETPPRWYHVRVAPLEIHKQSGAILIYSDVTQRREHELELSQVRTQLIQGERMAALGSLVSGVAHELRTPLTFLANNAFLLQLRLEAAARRGASAQEAYEESSAFLREITSGVDRINHLVEDLRRYTRARHDPQRVAAPLPALIGDAVDLFRATNRAANPVETSLAPTPPVRANKGAIQQVVLNLLQNASEASPPGSPLRVATRQEGERAVLEVSDRGSGIPPEVLNRMYEPLFTTKPEGTGLGLSIVRRIVEEHDGEIECETIEGSGTTFRVRFPREDARAERAARREPRG